MKAPPYDVSIDNISVLKRSGSEPVRVGAFTANAGAKGAREISLRGNGMTSSVGNDYAAYLTQALTQELEMAKRLNPAAALEVSGTLVGTDIDTAFGTASGYIEARFIVSKGGQVRYDKVKRGDFSWESSFIGAVAIPAAQRNYPVVVQHMLSSLYSDVDFQNALK
ncbi:MAG: hypothetical protein Q7U28_16855 [Aquabacterium sp.]|nr:hypothetical protein [Aquabacterium sp.]